ncbi:MAG TPA: hypothetical protein VJ951_12250 [Bacteroidales bacterium]|nr:hypothetical protein [Bacteroidales bacterium]
MKTTQFHTGLFFTIILLFILVLSIDSYAQISKFEYGLFEINETDTVLFIPRCPNKQDSNGRQNRILYSPHTSDHLDGIPDFIAYLQYIEAVKSKNRKEHILRDLKQKSDDTVVEPAFLLKSIINESSLVNDSLILVDLYHALNGKEWIKQTNWLTGNLSKWYGVTVDPSLQRVTKLDLNENRLIGALHDSLGINQLTSLVHLDLSNELDYKLARGYDAYYEWEDQYHWNQLSGQIPNYKEGFNSLEYIDLSDNQTEGRSFSELPSNWESIESLKYIDLSGNGISSTLPESWSKLKNLEFIYLGYNKISGFCPSEWKELDKLMVIELQYNSLDKPLPPEWDDMQRLEVINLSNNHLADSLPPEWSNMPTIDYINLSNNNLYKCSDLPESWGNLNTLSYLNLSSNLISVELPAEWSGMEKLKELYLNHNLLDDPLPPEWKNLKKLEVLYLNNNSLIHALPSEWAEMEKLDLLKLNNNALSHPLPSEWGILKNIRAIDLSNNQMGSPLPEEWGNMENLEYINLNNNQLDDPLPSQWKNLKSLTSLLLSNNLLDDPLPKTWSEIDSLEYLNLSNNQLSDPLPTEWGSLELLRYLDISHNRLNDPLPAGWSGMFKLYFLNLSYNQLDSPLPPEWKSCQELRYINLKNNLLDDPLPPEWGELRFELADLSYNNLDDALPPEWVNNRNLKYLFLNNNKLNHPLPEDWSNFNSLFFLSLANNNLSDVLPKWSNMTSLYYLFLDNNQIVGELPKEMASLVNLNYLDISNNNLSGSIPGEWADMKRISTIILSENNLTGNMPNWNDETNSLFVLDLKGNKLDGAIHSTSWPYLTYLNFEGCNFEGNLPEVNSKGIHGINIVDNNFSSLPRIKYNYSYRLTESSFMVSHISRRGIMYEKSDLYDWNHFFDQWPEYDFNYPKKSFPNTFYAQDNKLEFDDLENCYNIISGLGGIETSKVNYIPQDTIWKEVDTLLIGNSINKFQIPCGGNYNHYKWLKEDIQIAVPDKDNIVINELQPHHTGEYHTLVTNDRIKNLELVSFSTNISTISKEDVSCYGANDGRIEFNLIDSNENVYQYSVNEGATWKNEASFENLSSGEYPAFMLRNGNNGMPQSAFIEINEPEVLSIEDLAVVQPMCFGDSAYFSLDLSGGNGQYYSGINDSMITNKLDYSVYLPNGGEYTIFVRDQKGCKTEQTVDIYKPTPMLYQTPVTSWFNSYMNEAGNIKVNAEGDNLQYSIDAGFSWQSSPEFQNVDGGFYDLWIQDDKGCLKIYDKNPVRVPIIPPPIDLIIDNGKGTAELIFKGLFSCDENRLRIYSNWGTKALFDVDGYQNDFNFSEYPAGTYFYQLDFKIDNEWYFIKSFVEVIRKY